MSYFRKRFAILPVRIWTVGDRGYGRECYTIGWTRPFRWVIELKTFYGNWCYYPENQDDRFLVAKDWTDAASIKSKIKLET